MVTCLMSPSLRPPRLPLPPLLNRNLGVLTNEILNIIFNDCCLLLHPQVPEEVSKSADRCLKIEQNDKGTKQFMFVSAPSPSAK